MQYKLISFELSDKFTAWYRDRKTGANEYQQYFEIKLDAIGIGQRHASEVREIVGIYFTDSGAIVCNEESNFDCILPKGRQHPKMLEEEESCESECCYQKPDDVAYQIDKLQFSIAETRRELTEKFGKSQMLDAHFDYLIRQAERVSVSVSLTVGK